MNRDRNDVITIEVGNRLSFVVLGQHFSFLSRRSIGCSISAFQFFSFSVVSLATDFSTLMRKIGQNARF
jgi:hypothetical protein